MSKQIGMTYSELGSSLTRRAWGQTVLGAALAGSGGWLCSLAADVSNRPDRKRNCILLWMNGGPSTIDLWDVKPGHPNAGPVRDIATKTPGLHFGELLPNMAKWSDHLAIIRSMHTKEGDHGRATYLLRTGNLPQGPIQYPTIGGLLAKELANPNVDLPCHVRITPPFRDRTFGLGNGAGFLGPQFAPLIIGENAEAQANLDMALSVQDLATPAGISDAELRTRIELLRGLDESFFAVRPNHLTAAHQGAIDQAVRLMRPQAANAFRLDQEPAKVRDRYGRSLFGQGCLLARRLVERGVAFVEVALEGWDSHNQNFDALNRLVPQVDVAWSALMQDLAERGLLATTCVAWMGEFGRTPKINSGNGRDHYPNAWATVLAGGGIKGGQAIGKTSLDGQEVVERPVSVPDLLATVCRALGVDPMKQNLSNVGRPIRIVDKSARPIEEILA
jgi:Protein of unknown function (DUF1501)